MQRTQPVDPMTRRHRVRRILWVVLCLGWMSCGLQAAETALNPAPAPVVEKTLVVLGDSLSAGFGVDPAEAWPARIQEKIREARLPWKLVNAGVSGDTSAGGLRRLDWILRRPLEALLIELGGNDGLRGLPIAQLRENLSRILLASHQAGARLLLVGMRMPPNYGPQYTREFADSFALLARDAAHSRQCMQDHFKNGLEAAA